MEYIENNTNIIINKPHMSIVFLGHVDHGKSTICGNILYSLGLVDDRKIEQLKNEAQKNGMASWWLAYVMDQFDEEKEKGKTIEVGRAIFETEKRRYTILDAPGHKEYISNTIYALGHTDCAILVTSARGNEFNDGFIKGGQTKEHILLAKSMNVQKLIILVNKMDDQSCSWSQNKYDDIKNSIIEYIQKAKLGFKDIAFIPISGLMGDNLIKHSHNVNWYTGDTLINTLDSIDIESHNDNNNNLSVFTIMDRYEEGSKLNIVGRLESGNINKGTKMYILPSKKVINIEKIYSEFVSDSNDILQANCGEHVIIAIKSKDILIDDIQPGYVLCSNLTTIQPTMEFKVDMIMLSNSDNLNLITIGTQLVMHLKTIQICVTVKNINQKVFVKKGETSQVILTTSKPICCTSFKNFKILSRFVLRYDNTTVCIGRVTGIKPC